MEFSAEALERLMVKEGMNRSRLANRLGVSKATVTRVLNKNFQPSVRFLSALKNVFPEVSLEYFFKNSVARW